MTEFVPRRWILYRPFLIFMGVFGMGQRFLDLDIVSSGTFADKYGHIALFSAVLLSGVWAIEGFHLFNCRGVRLAVDENGFRLILRRKVVEARWQDVDNVRVRPLGLFIHLHDRILEIPLIPRKQQRQVHQLWFVGSQGRMS